LLRPADHDGLSVNYRETKKEIRPMNLFRTVIWPVLKFQFVLSKMAGIGAFGRDQARYIDGGPEPSAGPLKQALFRHHIRQYHESSCSVASVAVLLNALRDIQGRSAEGILSQHDILDTVGTANWKQRMSPDGDGGRRGLPLELLGRVVRDSLDAYGITYRSVETIRTPNDRRGAAKARKDLRARLHTVDPLEKGVILAHFNQGILVKALQIPHISPVGGFDPQTGNVTMLDVDYLQKKPYRVSFDRFYAALSSDYHGMFRSAGYGCGGYVYVRL
jgi:hypothetical protein